MLVGRSLAIFLRLMNRADFQIGRPNDESQIRVHRARPLTGRGAIVISARSPINISGPGRARGDGMISKRGC